MRDLSKDWGATTPPGATKDTTVDVTRIATVLLDVDGVLYRGAQALPSSHALLQFLARQGIAYACVTNNSTLTPSQRAAKLHLLGLAFTPEQIITSATVTRQYLAQQFARGTALACIGMDGLHDALFGDSYFVADDQRPQVVVVGQDRALTYAKCRAAARAISAGAGFIGTNPDVTVPTDEGVEPEAGAILAYLQAATGVAPTIIGKPAPTMFEVALALLDADPATTLVVGDRLDTDVVGAHAAGLASALVLTGVTRVHELGRGGIQPDLIVPDLTALLAVLREHSRRN
jgi:4-nitrophenyl phosphatase